MTNLAQFEHAALSQGDMEQVAAGRGRPQPWSLFGAPHVDLDLDVNIYNTTTVTTVGNNNTQVGIGSILSSFF